jgi:hypothetical protein
LFLFRQPFLLVPGVLGTVLAAGFFLRTMAANGRTSAGHFVTLLIIAPLVGFGLAVLTGLPAFMVRAALRPKLAFEPEQGEVIVKQERVNHFLRDEGRGGTLFITDRRIVFLPHRFNVQLDRVEHRLLDIRDMQWARVVTATGVPVSCILEIVEADRTEKYVVKDALALGAVIEEKAPSL